MYLDGRRGAFHSGPVIRVKSGADYPDERPALLRDPDNFFFNLDKSIGRQRGEPGHLLGEDAGFAVENLADFAKIDLKVAHQTLDNRSAKPIVVVQGKTPCDRGATRFHRFPVGRRVPTGFRITFPRPTSYGFWYDRCSSTVGSTGSSSH